MTPILEVLWVGDAVGLDKLLSSMGTVLLALEVDNATLLLVTVKL